MKRKPARDIPDFSRKGPKKSDPAHPGGTQPRSGGRAAPPPPRVKPPSTSSKSGQRGQ